MRPLRARLDDARRRTGVPWEVLERDYLISWILAGISGTEVLRDTLVFKGGTALKKCYFGAYRFSEDLDFTAMDGGPRSENLEAAVGDVCELARDLLEEYAPVEIFHDRERHRDPHPAGQEAFIVRARFPWQGEAHTRLRIEVTVDEPVLVAPESREIIHGYEEPLVARIRTYALTEIMAEKLRALLQHMRIMEERGWTRSRARDYYDLWRISGSYRDVLDLTGFRELLTEKCRLRDVSFGGSESFFQEPMLGYVRDTWEQSLGPLVPELPAFESVMDELRPWVAALMDAEPA